MSLPLEFPDLFSAVRKKQVLPPHLHTTTNTTHTHIHTPNGGHLTAHSLKAQRKQLNHTLIAVMRKDG